MAYFTVFNYFLNIYSKKLCTACSRTSYKIVLLTSLNKHLHNDTSETEGNTSVNNSREKILKKQKPLFLSTHVYMAMLAFIEYTDMTH